MRTGLAILAATVVAVGCTVTTLLPYGSPPAAGTASQLVGAAGGFLVANDGTSLLIPPGALTTEVTITIGLDDTAPTPAQARALAPVHVFGPPGQTFAQPVCVTLSYEPPNVPQGGTPLGVVVYQELGDAGAYLAVPTIAAGAEQVQGMTTSLSNMVVAYGSTQQVDAAPGGGSCDPGILEAGVPGE